MKNLKLYLQTTIKKQNSIYKSWRIQMENNALTVNLYTELKKSIENAESIDIIVSFNGIWC